MPPPADPDERMVLGIDVGGTKISVAQVEADGHRRGERSRRHHSNSGPESVVEEILALVALVRGTESSNLATVGVGVAAQVDEATGLVHHAPNLGWMDYPLGAALGDSLGVPVAVLNDARAATIAEWRFGAGQGTADMLVVFVGTGVGGSVVAGGRLLEGASGASGEVGHTILFAGGRKCHCPGRGCLEAYVGGWAIAERAREAVAADPAAGAPLLAEAERGGDGLGAASIGRAAALGVPLALRLVQETGDWLGQGVAGLVNAFNPARVVMGGGVVEGWPALLGDVEEAIRRHCQPPAAAAVTVHRVALGHDAVLIGAATVARERTLPARPREALG